MEAILRADTSGVRAENKAEAEKKIEEEVRGVR
jgi:hypothetical protein